MIVPHYHWPGKQITIHKVWVLLNEYHFHTTLNAQNPKLNISQGQSVSGSRVCMGAKSPQGPSEILARALEELKLILPKSQSAM